MNFIDIHGAKNIEDSSQDKLLSWLYSHVAGRLLLRPFIRPGFSKLAGCFLDSSISRCLIGPFIRANNIDMSDYEATDYTSYNDFFTRKIRDGARTIQGDEHTLISPCDCYATAYPITEDLVFEVKHTRYTLPSLLRSRKLAARFSGGYAVVLRLTVSDYHRYAYAVTGRQSKNYRIDGVFHTVNPVANDYYPIFKENTREYTLLHSSHLGDVLQMEVGALMVGKITNHKESCQVSRGEEKGYFEFGGSTIILLLQKNNVHLRKDLLTNTAADYETQLKLGDAIGVSMDAPGR